MNEAEIKRSNKLIPWLIVAFFAVVAILDGIFVYIANSTFTGVVTKEAYNEGLAYNETVAAADRRDALGWSGSVSLADNAELSFELKDADDNAIAGAQVRAEITRPTNDGLDFGLTLVESTPGRYSAPARFPRSGQWDVRLFVEWDHKRYQQRERLMVKP